MIDIFSLFFFRSAPGMCDWSRGWLAVSKTSGIDPSHLTGACASLGDMEGNYHQPPAKRWYFIFCQPPPLQGQFMSRGLLISTISQPGDLLKFWTESSFFFPTAKNSSSSDSFWNVLQNVFTGRPSFQSSLVDQWLLDQWYTYFKYNM